MGDRGDRGFTLIELVVVISIISLLMGIGLPILGKVRSKARAMIGMSNKREAVNAVNLFSMDNGQRYPDSVATVGVDDSWNWSDPTKLTCNRERSPKLHRSMSAYLRSYIKDADMMFCPNAPQKYKYLQQAWDAGDEWDNPETPIITDPVGGTYCFYWNYLGYLGGRRGVFRGPVGPASSRRYSKLVVSDYFGYDHWRSPGSYGSCEKLNNAQVVAETWLLSSYWSTKGDPNSPRPVVELQAGYTDGHVETYLSSETVPMQVSITADGTVPYPAEAGPGIYFVPINALR